MKKRWNHTKTSGLSLDLWETNGERLVHQYLLAKRAVTEQEEQEMAASVHAFALRSRQILTGDQAPTGEICDAL